MRIQIINGPNLNLLGVREPEIYGQQSFEDYFGKLTAQYPDIQFSYFQSNIEGELINKMQEVGFDFDGIVLNAGAYTHQRGPARLHTEPENTRNRSPHQQRCHTRRISPTIAHRPSLQRHNRRIRTR